MLNSILDIFVRGMVALVNAVLGAFATAINAVMAILPSMPNLPSLPTPFVTAESWVAWFFPVGTVIDVLGTVLALWLVWNVIAIALRWGKGISA